MAIDRSKLVKPNVQANLNLTRSENMFINIKQDTTMRLRFLPTMHPEGVLFYTSANHFKLKEAKDDGGDRGVALACLEHHGTDETGTDCYLCQMNKILKKIGSKAEKKIGKDIYCNPRYNAQVLVSEKQADGSWKYFGPRILGLPKGASEKVTKILQNMDMIGEPDFTDIKEGQDLLIERKGTGFNTVYSVDRTGQKTDLDELFPKWQELYIEDMMEAIGLKIVTREEQKQALQFTYGDSIDWERIANEYGI